MRMKARRESEQKRRDDQEKHILERRRVVWMRIHRNEEKIRQILEEEKKTGKKHVDPGIMKVDPKYYLK